MPLHPAIPRRSTGAVNQLLDYHPFGSLSVDWGFAGFDEKRKYIGEEYDRDTELSYLNARYYDALSARFLSQDPLFWTLPKEYLADPQQQNSYSYARNNPITMSDPSGMLTIVIPGTKYSIKDWSRNGTAENFIKGVEKTFGEKATVINDRSIWSGSNNSAARQAAAGKIMGIINNHDFVDGEDLNIIGHSHGGNIGITLSNMTDKKIDALVVMGTPARFDYQPDLGMIGSYISVLNKSESVQVWGGSKNSLSKLLLGELGRAGRVFEGAENLDVTEETRSGIISGHSMWKDEGVWSRVDELIN